jgi:hypothetical protein
MQRNAEVGLFTKPSALSLERSTLVDLLAPKFWDEQYEDRIDFQSPQQHRQDEQPFA